jgi:translation initiation factor 2 alpha subunit (eIF-2alpha)
MAYYNTDDSIFPQAGTLAVVRLKEVTTANNVYVELVEYNGVEGMIMSTEIQKYKCDANKIFKHGALYVVFVASVNKERRFVDLSYKKVKPAEKELQLSLHERRRKLHTFCIELADITGLDVSTVLRHTLWNVTANSAINESVVELDAYLASVYENPVVFTTTVYTCEDSSETVQSLYDLYPAECNIYVENLRNRIKASDMVMRFSFELTVRDSGEEGMSSLDKLKMILTTGINEDVISFVTAGKYEVQITASSTAACEEQFNALFSLLKSNVGSAKIKLTKSDSVVLNEKTYYVKPHVTKELAQKITQELQELQELEAVAETNDSVDVTELDENDENDEDI